MLPNGMFVELAEFPGYYVTDDGEVWSARRNGFRRKTAQLDRNGYPYVQLYNAEGFRNIKVHRLVAEAFLGTSTLQVNHKNGIKTDNTVENLEYCTARENINHAHRTGLRDSANSQWRERRKTYIAERCAAAKLTNAQVREMRALKGKLKKREVAPMFGVSEVTVKRVWNKKAYASVED